MRTWHILSLSFFSQSVPAPMVDCCITTTTYITVCLHIYCIYVYIYIIYSFDLICTSVIACTQVLVVKLHAFWMITDYIMWVCGNYKKTYEWTKGHAHRGKTVRGGDRRQTDGRTDRQTYRQKSIDNEYTSRQRKASQTWHETDDTDDVRRGRRCKVQTEAHIDRRESDGEERSEKKQKYISMTIPGESERERERELRHMTSQHTTPNTWHIERVCACTNWWCEPFARTSQILLDSALHYAM